MGDEHDSWFKPFGFDVGEFASNTVETVKNAVAPVVEGGLAANDFRIPEAPPPEPAQPTQPPEQPSNDDSGGGVTGNSGGAPFSKSGTTPPPRSEPTPEPIDLEGSVSFEQVKTVLGGLADGALEIAKEVVSHGLPGPVILVPIEKLLKEARGEPDPDDGA